MTPRKLNFIDSILLEVDQALRVIHTTAPTTERKNPVESLNSSQVNTELTESEKLSSASLMRVNHAGEVSAQGLYRGQALMSKSDDIKKQMKISAEEENDHLNWCEMRLQQLNSQKSLA